ncbi:MAG: hypothetical protein ICV54_12315 [Nostoc sp. C3-bin3]|nr:hypothetical protein [Nostoc sp. C3-bin3]
MKLCDFPKDEPGNKITVLQNSGMNWGKQGRQRKQGRILEVAKSSRNYATPKLQNF